MQKQPKNKQNKHKQLNTNANKEKAQPKQPMHTSPAKTYNLLSKFDPIKIIRYSVFFLDARGACFATQHECWPFRHRTPTYKLI